MRTWPLWLLLLVPLAAPQGPALEITVADATYAYGPETWKGGDLGAIDDQASLMQEASPWQASLGTSVTFDLDIRRHGALPALDWSYTVTLSDGSTILEGIVEVPTAGTIIVRFDVDGQRALPGTAEVPPLVPGTWRIHVDAWRETPTGTTPQGSGATTHESGALTLIAGGPDAGTQGMGVPEDILPGIREVGAGPNSWMPLQPLRGIAITLRGAPDEEVAIHQWRSNGPDAPDPAAATPLAGGDQAIDALVTWTQKQPQTVTLDPDGRLSAFISFADGDTGLWAVGMVARNGGSATFLAPLGAPQYRFTDITATPGQEGPVQLGIDGPSARAGNAPLPGQAFAISQEATDGSVLGGRLLANGVLIADDEDHWIGGFDGTAPRAAGVPYYAILALFVGPNGAYHGHVAALRGALVDMEAPTLGIGTSADIGFTMSHPFTGGLGVDPALAVPALVRFEAGGEALGVEEVVLPEGGAITRTWSYAPAATGALGLVAHIDTGDVYYEARKTVDVLSADDYDRATSPWYSPERLTPTPLAGVILALALALVVRKREIAP